MFKKLFNKLFNSQPENAISFKQGFELTELPICTLYQNGNLWNFLLDTGSNDSIIDKNVIDQIEHTQRNNKSEVFGLDGQKHVVNMCDITFSYKNQDFPFYYLIKDMSEPFGLIKQESGVNLHGIIGSKFFNKYKYILDFDELIAYSKV